MDAAVQAAELERTLRKIHENMALARAMAERGEDRTAMERAERSLAEVMTKVEQLHRANAEAQQNTAAVRTEIAALMARKAELEAVLQRVQGRALEHERRIQFAAERFGSADSPRGRIYVQNGPPAEIESRPTGTVEIWRYSGEQEFEFQGPGYELVRFRFGGKDYEPKP